MFYFFIECILYCVFLTGKRKDPGVPSSLPFKETVLKELEQKKLQVCKLYDIANFTS